MLSDLNNSDKNKQIFGWSQMQNMSDLHVKC